MSGFLGDLPRLFPRPEQTIAGIGRLLRAGEVSCVDILNACLEQVDAWESKVHAWVVLDREGAMAQARALDDELGSGKDRGPLHGIPIGVKDIIDVKGLPTTWGARRWLGLIVGEDSDVVAGLREAGAVILGKTVTTPYAWIDPPPTRNPWALDRTPGGSSSGSAAAVASGMCFGAIGSQTGGSITRPASFCGVCGLKPSPELVGMGGVRGLSASLDHVGPLARSVSDLREIFRAIRIPGRWGVAGEGVDLPPPGAPPRIARFRGFFDRRADPEMQWAFESSISTLMSLGAEVVELDDPIDFDEVLLDHRRVMAAEAADIHSRWLDECPEDYPDRIRDLILEGRSILAIDYLQAKGYRRLGAFSEVLGALREREVHAAITPATVGVAPNPSTTGDPAFNSPWSYCQFPTVSFPTSLDRGERLPAAVQLVGYLDRDDDLLQIAGWCEDAIRTSQS